MRSGWPVGVLFLLAVVPARAQQVDLRWEPWLGCWRLAEENIRQVVSAPPAPSRLDYTRVCVVPADNAAGVTLRTHIEDQPILEQTIVADGAQHPIDDTGCRGWQRAEWSRTGNHVFAHAELSCSDEARRIVSGLGMISDGAWIDVQAIEVAGRTHIRVRRYQRTADQTGAETVLAAQARSIAPRFGATRFTLEDVTEATAKVSSLAVEAALVETGASFALNSRALLELDKAGVPDHVIDLMVGLSFPDHFIVDRSPQDASASTELGWCDPYFYAPYCYSRFEYYPWERSAPARTESTNGGRLVKGVGYIQVRPREGERADSSTGSESSSDGSSSSSNGSSSDRSSAKAPTDGQSDRGSGTDTGRRAEPR